MHDLICGEIRKLENAMNICKVRGICAVEVTNNSLGGTRKGSDPSPTTKSAFPLNKYSCGKSVHKVHAFVLVLKFFGIEIG